MGASATEDLENSVRREEVEHAHHAVQGGIKMNKPLENKMTRKNTHVAVKTCHFQNVAAALRL